MNRRERIIAIITQALSPSHLELTDDSARHAGHAGASPQGETHYTLIVETSRFTGMGKVARHQEIYGLLAGEFKDGLHALSIQAFAPKER
jgi:BolA protein